MRTDPRRLIASLIVTICILMLPGAALAQSGASSSRSIDGHPAAAAVVASPAFSSNGLPLGLEGLTARAQPAQSRRSRDSLKNGTVIGAVVGAVALGALGAVVCKAYQEPSGPSCVKDALRFTAVGAAVGAGAGLAVDAARSQRAGVRVSVAVRF